MTRKQRADKVFAALRKVITEPETELNYQNNWQLLVSVLLSAQCTDARVNMVTPSLFERYPDSKTMSESSQSEIFKWIRSISYPNAKAGHLHKAAVILENEFGSPVEGAKDEFYLGYSKLIEMGDQVICSGLLCDGHINKGLGFRV